MTSFFHVLGKFRRMFVDHYQNKYISYGDAVKRWIDNRDLNYKIYDLKASRSFKTSDTLFILGSGPSLNRIGPSECEIIRQHNSFGISLSFLKEDLVPTFHHMSLESHQPLRDEFIRIFQKRREAYKNTVFFFSNKALSRLGHPRLTPEFFPFEPKCCFYELPQPIVLDSPRPFCDGDFDQSLFYRGTMSLVISIAVEMGYKKIILLGVDLQTTAHFFDGMKEVETYCKGVYDNYEKIGIHGKFESMTPKGNKYHPFDVYLYALSDYLKRTRDIEVFVGFEENMLYPKIEAYFKHLFRKS